MGAQTLPRINAPISAPVASPLNVPEAMHSPGVGVGHDPNAFEPTRSYEVCDFVRAQYAARKGDIYAWRNTGLALAARDGIEMIFSLNLLNGGTPDRIGVLDCPGTGGVGTQGRNCRMTPDQVREWGKLLGRAGCALMAWRYDASFVAKPQNQAAFSTVAITLAHLSPRGCSTR